MKLASVAVYTPGTGKRDVPKPHTKRHQHGHAHLHKKAAEEKRGDIVTAVIDGKTVTWENNWFGAAAAPTAAPEAPAAGAHSYPTAGTGTISSAGSTDSVTVGNFKRVGFYSAKDQVAEGLTFL